MGPGIGTESRESVSPVPSVITLAGIEEAWRMKPSDFNAEGQKMNQRGGREIDWDKESCKNGTGSGERNKLAGQGNRDWEPLWEMGWGAVFLQ